MTRYKLNDWEDNGYHDSYFHHVFYDEESDTLGSGMIGATAFAGGNYDSPLPMPTPAIVEKARRLLADGIFKQIRPAEDRDVLTPSHVERDARVRLLVAHRNEVREVAESAACLRCDGKGYWQNPRDPSDRRPCFGCKRTPGREVLSTKAVKGDDGKKQYVKIDAGAAGVVLWAKAFGKFYAKGYNKPGRDNTTVGVLLDDGRTVKVPLEKLRLDREPASDTDLRARADELSHGHMYKPLFSTHGGWLTHNYALTVASEAEQSQAA